MINKIQTQLEHYLHAIGEMPVTSANLGSSPKSVAPDSAPNVEEIKEASRHIKILMEQDSRNRQILLYILIALGVAWFVLCAGVIVFALASGKNAATILGAFGIDLFGLGLLLPFLHCVYQTKTAIDVFLATFPNMNHRERAKMTRSFLAFIKKGRCDIGRSEA